MCKMLFCNSNRGKISVKFLSISGVVIVAEICEKMIDINAALMQ